MCSDPLPHLSNLEPVNAAIKIFAVKFEPLHDADVCIISRVKKSNKKNILKCFHLFFSSNILTIKWMGAWQNEPDTGTRSCTIRNIGQCCNSAIYWIRPWGVNQDIAELWYCLVRKFLLTLTLLKSKQKQSIPLWQISKSNLDIPFNCSSINWPC